MRIFSGPDKVSVLAQKVEEQTNDVVHQLDLIEDDIMDVQSEIQRVRVGLTRLASLRAKMDAADGLI